MINITDIPHLRAYQPIVSLPKRNGEGSRGVVVFLSSPSLEESQTMLIGKTIQNASIRNYYVERIYHEKIGPRTEHLMVTMNDVPDKIKTNPSLTATRVNGVEILPTGSNRFIDLSIYNQLFFKVLNETNMTYTTICKEYMNMLKRTVVQDQYRIFPDKVILINLDDWQDFSTKTFGRGDSLNNPAAIIYYSLYKFPELVKELGDVNIVLYSQTSGYKVRINPSLTDGDSARRFRNEASRISPVTSRLMTGDFDTQLREEDVRSGIAETFGERYNLVGDTKDKTTTEIEKAVKNTVDKKDKENPDSILDTKDEIEEEVENDKELAGEVAKIIQKNKVGKSSTSSKRDEQLRKRQASIQIGNKSLSDILESKSANEIPVNNIDGKINTTNKNLMDVRFTNFEKAYNEQLLQKDIMSMVTSLNDARLPVHVRSVKIEDKSDELNYVDRYYIQLEDENRVRHQLTFDMPKFIDDKFMYLHGNRKEIVKQQLMLPIVKARESEVQIVSNYKKIFVRREGDKLSPKVEKFKKFIDKSPKGFTSKAGNNTSSNKGYIRTIEFDILASKYDQIDFGHGKIFFNLSKVEEMCNEKKIKFALEVDGEIDSIVIGFYKGDKLNGQPIYLNVKTQTIVENFDIVDFISSFATDEQHKEISSMSAGKRYMYTSATLMRKKVPIALLVAYHEGMSGLLRKSGVKYYFTDKRPKTTPSERVIQFEDGYLVYEESTMEQTLLLNGLSIVPTRAYKFEEFDNKDVYLDIFDSLYKQRNIASAFDNFYDFMIDPITKEVLEDLDLPTEYVDVLIYASNLLADNDYTEETDLSLYRIRSNEILNAYLYNAIATAYSTYIATANNPNPVKISIPRDVVVKEVLTAQTIEDYSILNPIVEVEKGRSVTAKGPSGANLSQSYTMAKRSYSPSMTGVMAMTSSPDANVGVVRALSTEPSITSARGYITDNQDRLKDLKDTNIFSPGELLSPLGASRDKWCCPTVWKHAVQELF